MKIAAYFVLFSVILSSVFLHFYKIDSIPQGYHIDELSSSITAQCLASEGVDAGNNHHPLFGETDYGSPKPPSYMYPAVLWGKVFGFSVPSLRSFSVTCHLLGFLGLFLLGRLFYGNVFALWVVFIAAISPWVWAPSRIAFESLLAPTFFIWGLYFFFRRENYLNWSLAGFLFALAMYSYPPMRLQVALMMGTLYIYKHRTIKPKASLWAVLVLSFGITLIPLMMKLFNGEVLERFSALSITSIDFLRSIGRTNSLKDIFEVFVDNYQQHLTPDFLIHKGYPSLILSLGRFGILSYLDMIAIAICFLSLMILSIKSLRSLSPWYQESGFLIFLLVNILIGIIPAALTNSDLPNPLRIVGSWPFMCLLSGFFMYRLQKHSSLLGFIVALIGAIFFTLMTREYFSDRYREGSRRMFNFWIKDQADSAKTEDDWMRFKLMYHNRSFEYRYYLMQYRSESCSESRIELQKQRALLQKIDQDQ